MYAVIKTGGKQHRVKAGDVIEVELIHSKQGESMTFTPLLVVDDDGKSHFGKDLAKAKVTAKLVGAEKGDKVKVFKYRAKTGYAKRMGHRQMHTLLEIEDVTLGKRAPSKKTEKEPTKEEVPAVEAAPAPEDESVGESASAGTAAPAEEPAPEPATDVEGAEPSTEPSEA